MTDETLKIISQKCERLQARLNVMRAAKRNISTDKEYMATLYDYREANRKRVEGFGPVWVKP